MAHRLHILGIVLANISGLIFTVNNGIIQMMKLDFSETLFVRGTIQVILLTFIVIVNGSSILPSIGENPWKVRFLTIFQGIYINFQFIFKILNLQDFFERSLKDASKYIEGGHLLSGQTYFLRVSPVYFV